ncbi:MAG: hypothetical protein ACE5H3_05685 [Planctomycetota bacterium]
MDLVKAYSKSVSYSPSFSMDPSPQGKRNQPDGIFWHGEEACTASLAAAAWQRRGNSSKKWAASTEISCERHHGRNGRGAGHVDLLLKSPHGRHYLIESKFAWFKPGKNLQKTVEKERKEAFRQACQAERSGFRNPWRLALIFVAPWAESGTDACELWKRLYEEALEMQPDLSAFAELENHLVWDKKWHPGVGLLAFKLPSDWYHLRP